MLHHHTEIYDGDEVMRFLTQLSFVLIVATLSPSASIPASAQEEIVTETVTCVSTDRRRTECPVNGRILNVRQTQAFAGGFCIQGFSWGYDQEKIWVDIGCSGAFDVDAARVVVTERPVVTETFVQTIDCRSISSKRKRCEVDGRIQDVEPIGSFTSIPCRYGTSWGYKKRHLWVDRGCEARFNVTYTQHPNPPQPKPEPVAVPETMPNAAPQTGLASASAAAVIAQGACTGLYPSLAKGGYVFSVPRECSKEASDCKSICEKLHRTVDNRKLRRSLRKRQQSCFNSIHVYDKAPSANLGAAGTQTYVYNSCGGGCGPNFCCCSAE